MSALMGLQRFGFRPAVGIVTVSAELRTTGKVDVVVLERFDRFFDAQGRVCRRPAPTPNITHLQSVTYET
jgi:hypothetical protein